MYDRLQVKGQGPVIEEGPGVGRVLLKFGGVHQPSRGPEEVINHVPCGTRYMQRDTHRQPPRVLELLEPRKGKSRGVVKGREVKLSGQRRDGPRPQVFKGGPKTIKTRFWARKEVD